jgi:transcriptional regulator NrdR family protein
MDRKIKVQKKEGSIENFDPQKIRKSMEKASIDASYLLEGNVDLTLVDIDLDELELELKEEDLVESVTIREWVLKKLDKIDSSIVKAWKNFERRYK